MTFTQNSHFPLEEESDNPFLRQENCQALGASQLPAEGGKKSLFTPPRRIASIGGHGEGSDLLRKRGGHRDSWVERGGDLAFEEEKATHGRRKRE